MNGSSIFNVVLLQATKPPLADVCYAIISSPIVACHAMPVVAVAVAVADVDSDLSLIRLDNNPSPPSRLTLIQQILIL